MHEYIEELKSDFKKMSEHIDILNGINPLSPEIQKLVNIGVLYLIYDKMKGEYEGHLEDDFSRAKAELSDAEKYLEMYKEKKDIALKSMASQELQHSHYYLDKLRVMSKNAAEQTKYNNLLSWYNNLLSKINA